MMGLFGGGAKEPCCVITRTLYEQEKGSNDIYKLKGRLAEMGYKKICVPFETKDPFISDMPLAGKDKERAEKLLKTLAISPQQAEEIMLAKNLGCPLMITQSQVWLVNAAKGLQVKTTVYK